MEKLRQDLAEIKTRTSTKVEPTYPMICTVMRVKNEERYIHRAISSLLPLHGEIIVLDDGSTDNTPDIVRSFDGVRYIRQDDLPMDEGRDRSLLLHKALELEPGWVFTLDGDEELPTRTCEQMTKAMVEAPLDVTVFRLHFVVMWGEDEYLVQNKFIWPQDRMFRVSALEDRGYTFYSQFSRNLHCGCVPKHGVKPYNRQILNAFIKYWGYESMPACHQKLDFYKEHDPAIFENTFNLVMARNRAPKNPWMDNLDCREIGIVGAVTY